MQNGFQGIGITQSASELRALAHGRVMDHEHTEQAILACPAQHRLQALHLRLSHLAGGDEAPVAPDLRADPSQGTVDTEPLVSGVLGADASGQGVPAISYRVATPLTQGFAHEVVVALQVNDWLVHGPTMQKAEGRMKN